MHGAGSPAAQRVLIQKLGQVDAKRGYARRIAGCGGCSPPTFDGPSEPNSE